MRARVGGQAGALRLAGRRCSMLKSAGVFRQRREFGVGLVATIVVVIGLEWLEGR